MIERRAVGDDADRGAQGIIEVRAFDRNHRVPPTVRYFRHTDDIRLFARFPSLIAELRATADGRIASDRLADIDSFVRECVGDSSLHGADYIAAVTAWGTRRDSPSRHTIPSRVRKLSPWWPQADVVAALVAGTLNDPVRENLLNDLLRSAVSCVSAAAAVRIAQAVRMWPARSASIGHGCGFPAGAACQGRHPRVGGIRQEASAAVGEQEVRAAGVQAPEVEGVAVVRHFARAEVLAVGRALREAVAVPAAHAQHAVPVAVLALAPAGVPPAEDQVGARRPFARQQGVRRAEVTSAKLCFEP